ncbi:hypothetical protein Asp14428_22330 [Actinoplanes sp. NBRC 14428]|nr:hypothetical protein Asp14428_22330 [Actinoplanes sp. NBRC 14428]
MARLTGDRLPGAHRVVVSDAGGRILAQHSLDGSTPPPRATLDPPLGLARTLEIARTGGRVVAGPPHVLPADLDLPPAQRGAAFDVVAPVRGATFRGWVVVAVRAPALLRESLRGAGVTGVTTVLTASSADGVAHEVARWSEPGATPGDRQGTAELAFAGRSWQVAVRPSTALIGPALDAAAPLAMLGATVLSLTLAAAVLAAGAGRNRAAARSRRDAATRRAAQERAAAAEQALRERETELAGFTAAAGEHLQTPLQSVAGFADLLLEDAGPQLDDVSRGFLERIGRRTRGMLTLVDGLITYSSAAGAAPRPQAVDATTLTLGVVADRLDGLEGRRPGIEVGDLPPVLADADLLGEVLGHLIDNAARFVRPGTAARISVDAREHGPGWWRIEVADRGIGVPEDHRDRIFAPFHRAPSAEGFPGTGLGLALCRRIVTLHGGEIGVDPHPGGGSIFWFTIPASAVAPDPGTELLAPDPA